MELPFNDFEDIRTIEVSASRLDAANVIQFKDTMRQLTEAGPSQIVLDLSAVTFLDSSGLGAVVAVLKALRTGQNLQLTNLTPPVERVFQLTRMDKVFSIQPVHKRTNPDGVFPE